MSTPRTELIARRRGFVLPVVILLIIVVGVTASIMLQRHVARSLTVRRQLDAYQEHHGARSIQAVIDAWLRTPTAQPRELAQMLEPDGLALTIDPGDGTSIDIFLFPGQGALLTRPTAVEPRDQEALARAIRILQETADDQLDYRRMTRAVGPIAIDPNTADPRVISAVVQGVLDGASGASQYESRLLDAALSDTGVTLQTLSTLASDAGLDPELRSAMNRFLTVTPEVWRYRIDQFGSPIVGSPLIARYRGLMLLDGSAGGVSNFERPPPFLSWESVDPNDPLQVE